MKYPASLIRRPANTLTQLSRKLFVVIVISLPISLPTPNNVHAAGDLDLTFGNGGKVTTDFFGFGDIPRTLAIQSDGKIIAAGYSGTDNIYFAYNFALARYKTDGSLDSTFGVAGKVTTDFFGNDDEIREIAIQDDGKIVAVGVVASPSTAVFGLAHYNADGNLDSTFGSGGKVITDFFGFGSSANTLIIQLDGKILVGGSTLISPTESVFVVARYNTDGNLDFTFGNGGKVITTFFVGNGAALALALQPDGKIIAGGFAGFNIGLVRYYSNGSLDTTFGNGGKVTANLTGYNESFGDLALQPNGKILISVGARTDDGKSLSGLARFDNNGNLDLSFGSNGKIIDFVTASGFPGADKVALQPDGRIVTNVRLSGDFEIARYNANGSLDFTFGTGGRISTDFFGFNDNCRSITVQSDGKIVATGEAALAISNLFDFALIRYNNVILDTCLQDDSTGNMLQFNSQTGDYLFTECRRKGVLLSGKGKINKSGCTVSLKDSQSDRRIIASFDMCNNRGTATISILPYGPNFNISKNGNQSNQTCACP